MGDLVLTDAALKAVVTDILQAATGAVAGILNGVYLGLATNAFTPDRSSVLADITEPTFATYARQAVTWGVPEVLSDGEWGTTATAVYSFRTATGDPAQVIFGYALFSAATAGVLLGAALFDAPLPLPNPSSVCALAPKIVLPLGNAWGKAVQLG